MVSEGQMAQSEPVRIYGYQVEQVLARGGMATVYLAEDLKHQRKVALKEILPHIAEDAEFIRRFRHEVRIHAQLHHPNILEVFEFGDGPRDFFIAMEYIDGGTLKFLLDRIPKFPTEIALFLTTEVLSGLSFAHARGIIHRDIKPANVFITRDGSVKLGDFGISRTGQMTRLTQTGDVIGTPAYMSPEQALGRAVDVRSDIFSTGVMLYETLSGIHPFLTDNPMTTIRNVIEFTPEDLFKLDPTISIECEELVHRMIAKQPEHRYPDAPQALAAVNACLDSLGLQDSRQSFRVFLDAPQKYMAERQERLSLAHLQRGKALLESKSAPPEVALWELYQAYRANQSSSEASKLFTTLSIKTGYRLGEQSENAKIKELEEKLKADPENVQLLLQLAKLYKLEKDFINMMRFFLKLKRLRIDDTYLEGQIDSLLGLPGAEALSRTTAERAARGTNSSLGTRETRDRSTSGVGAGAAAPIPARASTPALKLLLLGSAALLFLVALAVRSIWREATKPTPKIPARVLVSAEPADPSKIRADAGPVIARARQAASTGDNPAAIDLLESWTKKEINASHPNRGDVLLELGGLYEKVGRSDSALAVYGEVIREDGSMKFPARATRGDLLLRLDRDIEAERDFKTLQETRDPRWLPVAHYYLGRIDQRQNNSVWALNHFETLARNFPQHDLANEARLLAARLRLAEGSLDDASLLAREAQQHSKAGGEINQQATELLKEIDAKRSGVQQSNIDVKLPEARPTQP